MKVHLNKAEMQLARLIGGGRQERREKAGDKNAHGSKGGIEDHILGVMGEIAFAKLANLYPSGLWLDRHEDDDVGGIQVRTRRKDFMELYLWERDEKDCLWALMIGTGPWFECKGLIHGTDAAVERYWTPARPSGFPRVPCWVVPHSALRPVHDVLPARLAA